MKLKIHAICIALNEEIFIEGLLNSLYKFCSGISIITQFDRDYYGKVIKPDATVNRVLNYNDPAGKIHLVMRKYNDETVSRNHEMLSLISNPIKGVVPYSVPLEKIKTFHERPDYFLIVDPDEIYDVGTFENIVDYLADKRPKGMRVRGYNYLKKWNCRIPNDVVNFVQFGFVKPGLLFSTRRVITWNEFRIKKLLSILKLPDFSAKLYGFINCPEEVGVFHHGIYLGDEERLKQKYAKHSHQESNNPEWISEVLNYPFDYIETSQLPVNIQKKRWPQGFID